MAPKKLPQFANEAEEARWWFEHRSEVAEDLIVASRSGLSGEGSRGRALRRNLQPQSKSGSDTNRSESSSGS